jgi:purine-binding chemotaxis protein CheW
MNAAALPSQTHWVCFALEGQRFALPLASVIRIVRASEITPLPHAPDIVAGAIDVAGHILPVFDLRRHLRLPVRALKLDDQFLIARSARRQLALIIDAALGVVDASDLPPVASASAASELARFKGVLSLPDGLALIEDLESFLTAGEETALDSALREAGNGHAG